MDGIDLALNRDRWQAVVNVVMKLCEKYWSYSEVTAGCT